MLVTIKKYAIVFGVFLFLSFAFITHSVHALQLSPIFFDLSGKPGESVTRSITLTNDTNSPIILDYQKGIFMAGVQGDGKPKLLPQPTDTITIADWITIPTPTVTLQPGGVIDAPYTITVPFDAPTGGHYAWISWNEVAKPIVGTGVAVAGGIAAQILFTVEGDEQNKLILQSFQTKSGLTSFEKLPIVFVANIFNEGNVHQKPTGHLLIKNMFGSPVASIPFNEKENSGNVLPKEGRAYEVAWDKGFAFGKYSAMLSARYNDETPLLTSQIDFWVLPKALVVVSLLILAIIIGAIA
ncbi:MAG: hypothetical protein Q8Q25_01445, partial [bacterium]|nr:hypothetical protein [bacterium]